MLLDQKEVMEKDKLYADIALHSVPFLGWHPGPRICVAAKKIYSKSRTDEMDYYFHTHDFWYQIYLLKTMGYIRHTQHLYQHRTYNGDGNVVGLQGYGVGFYCNGHEKFYIQLTWKGRLQRLKQLIHKEYEY